MKRKEEYAKKDVGGDSDSERPITKKKRTSDDSDAIVICEISKNRKVSVRNWQGKKMVDIREFYENKDSQQLPGKKGISLTMDQWNILRDHVDAIDKAVAENS